MIVSAILLIACLYFLILRKAFFYLPAKELKHQARHGDDYARKLYKAVAYGVSLRTLLWLAIVLTGSIGLIFLARNLPVWGAAPIAVALAWLAISWLPSTKLSRVSAMLTAFSAPAIAWTLEYLRPWLEHASNAIHSLYPVVVHTGMFGKEDLLHLLEQQESQLDSRLNPREIQLAMRALSFDKRKVADVLVQGKEVYKLSAHDVISPILLDELHKTGQAVFPVVDGHGELVGLLPLKSVGLRTSGQIHEFMDENVNFVNDQDSLDAVLRAFCRSDSTLFAVVNNFDEYVGVISLQDVLNQLVGESKSAELDLSRQVAAARPEKDRRLEEEELKEPRATEDLEEPTADEPSHPEEMPAGDQPDQPEEKLPETATEVVE